LPHVHSTSGTGGVAPRGPSSSDAAGSAPAQQPISAATPDSSTAIILPTFEHRMDQSFEDSKNSPSGAALSTSDVGKRDRESLGERLRAGAPRFSRKRRQLPLDAEGDVALNHLPSSLSLSVSLPLNAASLTRPTTTGAGGQNFEPC
jgi:hypothetical protein